MPRRKTKNNNFQGGLNLDVMREIENKIVVLATDIGDKLIEHTPIDTGRAKSNWRASYAAPISGAVAPYSPGTKGNTADQNIVAAKAALRSDLAKKFTPDIYITNNVEYIRELNQGTSQQAPAGFVESAVMQALYRFKGGGR